MCISNAGGATSLNYVSACIFRQLLTWVNHKEASTFKSYTVTYVIDV